MVHCRTNTCLQPSRTYPQRKEEPVLASKKMLMVSNVHGKNVMRYMSNLGSDYSVCSIVKQGASDKEIIRTALEMSKNFTREDIVILWTNQTSQMLKTEYVEKSVHTRTVIVSEHYRYNILKVNQVIYENNLNFLKDIHTDSDRRSSSRLFESNNSLRRRDYRPDGYLLKNNAKIHLTKALRKFIDDWDLEIQNNAMSSDNCVRTGRMTERKSEICINSTESSGIPFLGENLGFKQPENQNNTSKEDNSS